MCYLRENFTWEAPIPFRGYQYRSEIGPVDGGNVEFVSNIEYKFPIVEEKKHLLQGVSFFDVGGAWESMSDFSLSVGDNANYLQVRRRDSGSRFTTPVFPLRLGLGIRAEPQARRGTEPVLLPI